jgi:Uma2 family endonuclease
MALAAIQPITLEAFEAFLAEAPERERRYELIDGAIIEKAMPTDEHSLTNGVFIGELYVYSRANGIGLPGPEHRFRFPGENSRIPDIALIIDPNVPITTKGASLHMPDIIVEVKSPDDTYDKMRERARFYIANGVRIVWLVFTRARIVEVYRPNLPSEILTADDTIEGYDVLPGFSFPAARLFMTKRSGE